LHFYPGGRLPQLLYNIITYGAQLGYTGSPKHVLSDNLASAREDPDTITTQLYDDLRLGRVSPHNGGAPFFSSPLGLTPKHNGNWRRIHHLSHPEGSSVNDWIPSEYGTLQYTTIELVFDLLRTAGRGALLIKKDLKDAFRMIPVAPHERWLLGFQWQGQYYHENCLPFGLRTAPFIFNLFAEGLHWILQSHLHWQHLAHYLDDFVHMLPAPHKLTALAQINDGYNAITDYLGLLRNDTKDESGYVIEILGIEIDSLAMAARLSLKKLAKATSLVTDALTSLKLTQLQAQKLTGFLSFCTAVVPLGRTFLRRLWDFTSTFVKPRSLRLLSEGATKDLQWWRDFLPQANGRRLLEDSERRVLHLFTDASSIGIGAFWYYGNPAQSKWPEFSQTIPQRQAFSHRLTPLEKTQHINALEVLAVETAFRLWSNEFVHSTVILYTDNTTAESGFRYGTVKGAAIDYLRDTLLLAATIDANVITRRITTKDNVLADALSRFDWPTVAKHTHAWQVPLATNRPPNSSG
jgi:hypothetical protein